ncbi:MAG: DNA recombination protein RmuC [Balneolales bacterium]
MELLYLITGLVIGSVAAWLLKTYMAKSQGGLDPDEANGLKEELNTLTTENSRLGERNDNLKADYEKAETKLKNQQAELSNLQQDNATLKANYRNLEEKLADHKDEVNRLQEKFTTEFKNLANQILEEKSKKFTDQNKINLDQLLQPLGEKIKTFQKKVEDTHLSDVRERSSLQEQIKGLTELNQKMSLEANNLVKALKGQAKTQGNWGEMILERILEKSGLQKDREFVVQESLKDDDGRRQQPDVIINLPDQKNLVVDSKVSLNAYERYSSAEEESVQLLALKDHIQSVRTHVRQLSDKKYQDLYEINSPNFVLLFIPIEPAFGLAIQHDPQLYEDAFEKNIVIVSPTTLLATLATIKSIWKQEYQNRNTAEIAKQSGNLLDKFVNFVKDLEKVGERMDLTRKSYDDAMNKLKTGKGNLVSRTENIRKLGVKTNKVLSSGILTNGNGQENGNGQDDDVA